MKKYLVYDPVNSIDAEFETEEEALKYAKELIPDFLEDDGWDEDVERIIIAEIKYVVEKTDVVTRPSDDELKDGYDSNGIYWYDFDHMCQYRMVPVETVDDMEKS